MKPRPTPLRFKKASRRRARTSMIADMSTSLNVVSMAAVRCASSSRWAMVWRRRDMRMCVSRRAPSVDGCSGVNGLLAAAGAAGLAAAPRWRSTSSRVTRPPVPVPSTFARSRPCSSAMRRATGDACGRSASSTAGAGVTLSVAEAGAAAGAAAPSADPWPRAADPASIVASTSPGWTVSPSLTAILPSTPASSVATSTLTFSVSSWTSASPASTASPSCLSQAPTVASTIDSPRTGTRTSTLAGMGWHPFKEFGNDAVLLTGVCLGPALGRTGPIRASDVAQRPAVEQVAQPWRHERPGAHVAGLFLQPDHLARLTVSLEHVGQRLSRKRIQLFDPHDRQAVDLRAPRVSLDLGPDVPAAQHDAADAVRVLPGVRVVKDRLEAALDQLTRT